MSYAIREVLEFVKQNDVKFIRLAFCDIFGTQKNISIMPDELERAFKEGVSFDASAIYIEYVNVSPTATEAASLIFTSSAAFAFRGTAQSIISAEQQANVVLIFLNIKSIPYI